MEIYAREKSAVFGIRQEETLNIILGSESKHGGHYNINVYTAIFNIESKQIINFFYKKKS